MRVYSGWCKYKHNPVWGYQASCDGYIKSKEGYFIACDCECHEPKIEVSTPSEGYL